MTENEKKMLEKIVNKNGRYIIPVQWSVYSTVTVEADNLADALNKFEEKRDDIPLSPDSEYIEDSYEMTCENAEELIDAQEYREISTVAICKDGTILD